MGKRYSSFKNTGWTVERLQRLILRDNPNITSIDCKLKAESIYNELERINKKMKRNTKNYFKHNLPFSYFENDENFLEYFDIQD
jgi:hypothetical protein